MIYRTNSNTFEVLRRAAAEYKSALQATIYYKRTASKTKGAEARLTEATFEGLSKARDRQCNAREANRLKRRLQCIEHEKSKLDNESKFVKSKLEMLEV